MGILGQRDCFAMDAENRNPNLPSVLSKDNDDQYIVDNLKNELELRKCYISAMQETNQDANMRATTDSIKVESDVLRNDLKLMDASYHGLQQRYYKLRTVGENMRSNEQQMKKACDNYERRLSQEQERYKLLKSTARNQLNLATEQVTMGESNGELTRKDMELRLLRNETMKLSTQLEQKTTENTELVTICEQLM